MRGDAAARDRCRLGDALALIGDPRFRADAWSLPNEPLLGFIEVPAGPFRMGSDKQRDSRAYDDEEPAHEVVLPAFYVARFPVTVAQFEACVRDGGVVPVDGAWERGVANHPVVGVSWREAVAYCEWLTRKLVGWRDTPGPLAGVLRRTKQAWRVVLPSEAEWEKAARGTDGRVYPYLGEFDPAKGNVGATGIGTTSSVGCFEGGASACGALDMSGNVWEWTRSARANYPYAPGEKRESMTRRATASRGVRGGSFGSRRQGVRAACRSGDHPGNRSPDVGFRVVVSPFFSDL
jgi:formylglycine-generating enzyme required for sulfatase activity